MNDAEEETGQPVLRLDEKDLARLVDKLKKIKPNKWRRSESDYRHKIHYSTKVNKFNRLRVELVYEKDSWSEGDWDRTDHYYHIFVYRWMNCITSASSGDNRDNRSLLVQLYEQISTNVDSYLQSVKDKKFKIKKKRVDKDLGDLLNG